jgi:hypothetical protein
MKLKSLLLASILRLIVTQSDDGGTSVSPFLYRCPQNSYAKIRFSPLSHDPNIARISLSLGDSIAQNDDNNAIYCHEIAGIQSIPGNSRYFTIGEYSTDGPIYMYGAYNPDRLCSVSKNYLNQLGYTVPPDYSTYYVRVTHVIIPEQINADSTPCLSFNRSCPLVDSISVKSSECGEDGLIFSNIITFSKSLLFPSSYRCNNSTRTNKSRSATNLYM